MTKLSKCEKETIINWNEMESTANICTYNAGLKKRLAAFSQKYPDLCRMERLWQQGGVSYQIDKTRLSVRLVPPYSEERRQQARLKGRDNGFGSKAWKDGDIGHSGLKMSALYSVI